MTSFVQPQNREADLQAILEGYEGRIAHPNWLIDALQKDGIQNSWDARLNKNSTNWSCKIFYKKLSSGMDVVGIEDKGTAGLTGSIPKNLNDVVFALQSDDPEERLAYFSSSNWSKKTEDALGSRGRGKMIFVGASRKRMTYFDSIRSDDGIYIFGKTYLDENKSISVDILSGEEAENKRKEIFGTDLNPLDQVGTRILIPFPREEVVDGFVNEKIVEYIQHTWWEILEKYDADIQIENDGWIKKVEPSGWLPVAKLGIKETEIYENIPLNNYKDLRIKRISLAYLGDKGIPDLYKGIAIQRSGMVVQHVEASKLIGDQIGDKIFGNIELDKKLENEMRLNESPEHYSIFWTREIPRQLRLIIKEKTLDFAQKYKLIEEEKEKTNSKQRRAEVAVQRELNDLAKRLGLKYGTGLDLKRKKKHLREPDEPLRISVPDFETPIDTGRVNYGESLKGLCAIPINNTKEKIKVLLRTYIIHNDTVFKKENVDLVIEQEIDLDNQTDLRIGWEEMEIDNSFPVGQYYFRAKMIAMEDRKIDENLHFEKGDEIYKTVSRAFYVEEDPEDKGLFKLQRDDRNNKKKYFWWEMEDKTWIIYWNGLHPSFRKTVEDEELLQAELRKMSYMIFFSILCSEDKVLADDNRDPKVFDKDELMDSTFDDLLQTVFRKQSEILWDKFQ